jgi:hypothetical protein
MKFLVTFTALCLTMLLTYCWSIYSMGEPENFIILGYVTMLVLSTGLFGLIEEYFGGEENE